VRSGELEYDVEELLSYGQAVTSSCGWEVHDMDS
jgi:hypothetical protein